uniref:thioesterase domain-containing protein n=1 Tax=Roseibium sp. TaxID=1936156 RepID=UPI003D101060
MSYFPELSTTTAIEEKLTDLATDVLKRPVAPTEAISRKFNVNKLLQLIQRFYAETGIELDVNCVFVYRTIRELAKAVDQGTVSNMPKLLTLREGDKSRPLIVFAGGVNCFLEIKSVLEGLDFDGVVYGIRLSDFDCPVTDPASVSDEIEACSQELARQGIVAPVSLVGYSLGGIFALELARKIQQSGQKIRFLGLVDPLHSEHTWPWNIWAGYVFQLLLRRLWRLPREILKGLKPGISASKAAQATDPPRRHPLLQELQ